MARKRRLVNWFLNYPHNLFDAEGKAAQIGAQLCGWDRFRLTVVGISHWLRRHV